MKVTTADVTSREQLFLDASLWERLQCKDVDEYSAQGFNLNIKDCAGSTALMLASLRGNIRLVRKLLELKADANAQDKIGRTALHYAAQYSGKDYTEIGYEIALELLKAGADPDLCGDGAPDTTVLVDAVFGRIGGVKIMDELVRRGAGGELNRAFRYALMIKNVPAIHKLLKLGADVYAKNIDGDTALDLVELSEDWAEIAEILRESLEIH